MKFVGRPLGFIAALSSRPLLVALVLLSTVSPSVGQSPASRPILFAHGFCGSAFDFQTLLTPLFGKLPRDLYPSSDIYYVAYNVSQDTVTFYLLVGNPPILFPVNEASIPATTRFFSVMFGAPDDGGSDATGVAKVSVLNKGYELSRVIKRIIAVTQTRDLII